MRCPTCAEHLDTSGQCWRCQCASHGGMPYVPGRNCPVCGTALICGDSAAEVARVSRLLREAEARAAAAEQECERLRAQHERVYPCSRCGVLRSKSEGGTTFTVCDACWDLGVAP